MGFVMVFTTVSAKELSPEDVLELYRVRWHEEARPSKWLCRYRQSLRQPRYQQSRQHPNFGGRVLP